MNSSKLNILFLSSWYPNRTNKTLGNFVQRHAESVAVKNNVVVLYISKDPQIGAPFEISDEVIHKVRTIIVYFRSSSFDRLIGQRMFKKGIAYLKEKHLFSFDIVHHNVILNAGWQALYLKRKYKLPYIITEHWTGFHNNPKKQIKGWKKMLAKKVGANAAVLCPVSIHLKNAMSEFGIQGNYEVVYNVVDTDLFKIQEKTKTKIRMIHVSHLGDDHKNVSGLIRSFSQVLEEEKNVELLILGDGNIKPYEELRNELKIGSEYLQIIGEQPLETVAQQVASSDVFVLFSNYENLPCVIVEAFACGIPVISTTVGGVSEILSPERGYLIEKKDEQALAKNMLRFIKEYPKFDANTIRAYAINEFSMDSISEKFDSIYYRILN